MATTESTKHKFFTFPISMLKNFMISDSDFNNVLKVATFYYVKMQNECHLQGYTKAMSFLDWYYGKGDATQEDFWEAEKLFNKYSKESHVVVSIPTNIYWNVRNHYPNSDDFEHVTFLAYAALRSIAGRKGDAHNISLDTINARMEGFSNYNELKAEVKEAVKKALKAAIDKARKAAKKAKGDAGRGKVENSSASDTYSFDLNNHELVCSMFLTRKKWTDEMSKLSSGIVHTNSFNLLFNHEYVSMYLTRKMWAKVMEKLTEEYHVTFIREPGKHCRGFYFKIRSDDE